MSSSNPFWKCEKCGKISKGIYLASSLKCPYCNNESLKLYDPKITKKIPGD